MTKVPEYSVSLLASILSLPRTSIEEKIKRGELTPCEETGLISIKQFLHFPVIKQMFENKWEEELTITPNRQYNFVDLFSGGGGLALGMEQAGFDSVLLNDIDKHACSTLRHNRPDWNVIEGDVANIDFSQIINDVDLLTGSFPCQAFSCSGISLRFKDTRGTPFFEMARAIKELQPKVFLAENVRALLTQDCGNTLTTIKNVINELGYTLVEPKVLKAIFYKVPQEKDRLIIIGIRNELADKANFCWPSVYKKIMTLQDALYQGELFDHDVPHSQGLQYPKRKREIMDQVPQGGYWRDLPDELQREYMKGAYSLGGRKTGVARRLSLKEPSLTLCYAPALKFAEHCHPLETRPLTIREYARIQTFPDDWEFQGSLMAQYRQIAIAMPVNMGAALGRALIRFLNDIENSSPHRNVGYFSNNQKQFYQNMIKDGQVVGIFNEKGTLISDKEIPYIIGLIFEAYVVRKINENENVKLLIFRWITENDHASEEDIKDYFAIGKGFKSTDTDYGIHYNKGDNHDILFIRLNHKNYYEPAPIHSTYLPAELQVKAITDNDKKEILNKIAVPDDDNFKNIDKQNRKYLTLLTLLNHKNGKQHSYDRCISSLNNKTNEHEYKSKKIKDFFLSKIKKPSHVGLIQDEIDAYYLFLKTKLADLKNKKGKTYRSMQKKK